MSAAVCPYCRTPVDAGSEEELLCTGCGTPHHKDCYQENGGCTVFGCSQAPSDEQKVSITGQDLTSPRPASAGNAPIPGMLPGVGLLPPGFNPNAPPKPVKAPPPPMPDQPAAAPAPSLIPRAGVGSMFFTPAPLPPPVTSQAPTFDFDLTPDPNAKNRSTFIILGALLGFFGAHNFYAGYTKKGVIQFLLTLLTLGFAGIMSWVWAVIDVCTVDRDSQGIKFKT
jgi:TM2 domain-containing membrane protein YozV